MRAVTAPAVTARPTVDKSGELCYNNISARGEVICSRSRSYLCLKNNHRSIESTVVISFCVRLDTAEKVTKS